MIRPARIGGRTVVAFLVLIIAQEQCLQSSIKSQVLALLLAAGQIAFLFFCLAAATAAYLEKAIKKVGRTRAATLEAAVEAADRAEKWRAT